VAASTTGGDLELSDPGVVELPGGSLLTWCRSNGGVQYFSRSGDAGQTWSAPELSSIVSPNFPACIRRIPQSDSLLLVWNAQSDPAAARHASATPLSVAVTHDNARTWSRAVAIEDNLYGIYSHAVVACTADRVIIAYRSDDQQTPPGSRTQIANFSLEWLNAKLGRAQAE
jgi:hypothetical protein